MIAEINGIRLAYSDTGSGTPVVLLVHGFPLNRSMWEPQLGALRERARVIAPDLRGFGASEAGPPGPLTMSQHADDVFSLLQHLDVQEPSSTPPWLTQVAREAQVLQPWDMRASPALAALAPAGGAVHW